MTQKMATGSVSEFYLISHCLQYCQHTYCVCVCVYVESIHLTGRKEYKLCMNSSNQLLSPTMRSVVTVSLYLPRYEKFVCFFSSYDIKFLHSLVVLNAY